MAVSDDEIEAVAPTVTDYHFVDDDDEPASFSFLPVQWSANGNTDPMEKNLYLRGTVESGLEKIHKQVIAWKLELLYDQADVLVLCKDKSWIKLRKARKSFEDTIRDVLITVQYLHFVKKHPETTEKSLWGHLQKTFSLFDVRPSEKDLVDHIIRAVAKRDGTLSRSKLILAFLKNPWKRKELDDDILYDLDLKKPKFIVGDVEEDSSENIVTSSGDESDSGRDDICDSVCALCDNGGTLLCCEGECLRAFHATIDAGIEAGCKSLGLSKARVEAIEKFLCLNCQYKRHQCFACGKLGSSDKSCDAEVFPCNNPTCGYFYHARCVAKLLHPVNEAKAEDIQKSIIAGETFDCPVHRCLVCKQEENKDVFAFQFAVCRRCPKAYHRKCLPSGISLISSVDKGIIQRAWDDILPRNRVLVYCLEHNLNETLSTPERNHIKFPSVEVNKKPRPSESSQVKVTAKEKFDYIVYPTKNPVKTPKQSEKVFPAVNENNRALEEGEINPKLNKVSGLPKPRAVACKKLETAQRIQPIKKDSSSTCVDTKREERALELRKQKIPSITSKKVITKQKTSSACEHAAIDKADSPRKSVQTPSPKLEECNVEVAKADFDPQILNQITKLKVVDKLHWYIQNGDTVVSFCCDADDYGGLMKQKLEETGKRCSVKNYHVFQPKIDNNLNRDWITVYRTELPTGTRLIIGLTLNLGVKRALADKVIEEALELKPKLLVLIVPREIKRLDRKTRYDLIWEDSANITDKSPSLLYLWSRSDWTSKHEDIALKHRHISQKPNNLNVGEKHNGKEASTKVMIEDKNEPNTETRQPTEARAVAHAEAKQRFVPEDNIRIDRSRRQCDEMDVINENYDQKKKQFSDELKVQDKGKQPNGKVVSHKENDMFNTRPQTGFSPSLLYPLSPCRTSGGWLEESVGH